LETGFLNEDFLGLAFHQSFSWRKYSSTMWIFFSKNTFSLKLIQNKFSQNLFTHIYYLQIELNYKSRFDFRKN